MRRLTVAEIARIHGISRQGMHRKTLGHPAALAGARESAETGGYENPEEPSPIFPPTSRQAKPAERPADGV
ncbi:MAG: hypothetical protein V8T87_10100 [Victivallales bacterium]